MARTRQEMYGMNIEHMKRRTEFLKKYYLEYGGFFMTGNPGVACTVGISEVKPEPLEDDTEEFLPS